jgi:hypothetical protein
MQATGPAASWKRARQGLLLIATSHIAGSVLALLANGRPQDRDRTRYSLPITRDVTLASPVADQVDAAGISIFVPSLSSTSP